MADWPEDELKLIANSDDLHIAPLRDDGVTFGTPTWIWSVVVDGGGDGLEGRSRWLRSREDCFLLEWVTARFGFVVQGVSPNPPFSFMMCFAPRAQHQG
jgi:hypothetical protein